MLSIPAVFMIFYAFNDGETNLNVSPKHSQVPKAQKGKITVNPANDDNLAAAILIIPKSYLPALKQFSNSVTY